MEAQATRQWFCGVNSSYLDESMDWYDDLVINTCFVNGLATIPHAAFLLLSSLVLLVVGCCTGYRRVHTKYLLVYPGHSVRWLLSMLLLVVVLASIGEGVMTDETYQAWQQPTQPHLYVHSIVAFAAVALSLVYYHHMELWQLSPMSLLLFLYWLFSLCNEVVQIVSLAKEDAADVHLIIFDLTLIKLAIYGVLCLLEANVIKEKLWRCSSKIPLRADLGEPEMLYTHSYVNTLSHMTFWWANWLPALGFRKNLEMSDLGVVPERHEANFNHEKFQQAFHHEKEAASREGREPSLFRVYMKAYGRRLFGAAILKLVGDIAFFINPLALGALTAYVTSLKYPDEDAQLFEPHRVTGNEFFKNGCVLVGVIFIASTLRLLSSHTHGYIVNVEGLNARSAIQVMVYGKALRLSALTTPDCKKDMGQITNHIFVDPNNVKRMFEVVNNLWAIPVQLIVNLILLYTQLGSPALIGASVFLLCTPIQMKIVAILGGVQKKILQCSDERLKRTNELLHGIKLLKMYAWEGLFSKAIKVSRDMELKFLLKGSLSMLGITSVTSLAPVFVPVVAFGVYTPIMGRLLTPDVAFSSLSLFHQLSIPLMMLPLSVLMVVNGVISTRRVWNFLEAAEIEEPTDTPRQEADLTVRFRTPDQVTLIDDTKEANDVTRGTEESTLLRQLGLADGARGTPKPATHLGPPLGEGVAIKITDGNFRWGPDASSPDLSDINVEVPKGKLTVIIGQVGSGKSSLLSAILGEMSTASGTVQIEDRNQIALAAQKPWLLNTTLRENILFSLDYDAVRYRRILDACSLKPDIDILPGGDQTEIGEKGINLSGGQKQRVSVARTMYSGRDIVILDDPLSALDVHVGSFLFEDGIVKYLLGHNRTVVLVTHQLQYLNRADLIIEMKNGRIAAQGNLDDIIAADPDMYSEFDKAVKAATEESEVDEAESEITAQERLCLQRLVKTGGAGPGGHLITEEEMERGAVSRDVYRNYVSKFGLWRLFLVLVFAVVFTSFGIVANFWLSRWSESGLYRKNETDIDWQVREYFAVFFGLSSGTLLGVTACYCSLAFGILAAARRLHQAMIQNITRVPIRFFDTTPVGRVLNRVSNDVKVIDTKMTDNFFILLSTTVAMLATVVVNSIVTPVFIAFFVPIAVAYYILQTYYLTSSRELQRLDSVTRSPIVAFFSESLNGLSTIRAYRVSDRFAKTIAERINANLPASFYLQLLNNWLAVRLDFLGAFAVFGASLSTLIAALTAGLDPSLVGLAITYSLQVAGYMNFYVATFTTVEMNMNAVERVMHYSSIDNEQYEGDEPSPDWPQQGEVRLERVSVRYGHETDTVLKDITVDFKPGQRVGICGRTGAGKSSLALSLLRMIDTFDGRILIDGVDIKTVPLTTLRSRLSIIPQDPILFRATIRKNLDPVGQVTDDDELWRALEIAQLKSAVSSLEGGLGLDSEVTAGGENFSVGQRQLFCLARAFLRKSRILIMDEATASIDFETEKVLQAVVASAFEGQTVLTIAHRITTILKYDVIVVLDEGRLAESGPPGELAGREGGIFASFVRGSHL